VPHFNVPTIGFRVDVGDASIAFSSDQIGTNEEFTKLAANVNVLVVHFAASEEPEQIAALHAKPSVWGQMAANANAGSIVLSHISTTDPEHPRYWMHSGSNLERNIAHVRSRFDGSIIVAKDLMCVPIE
jgi:ribonuclease BN (tRNA processing enzyme)